MNFIAQLPLCICRFIGLPHPQTPSWHLAGAHETHSCNYKTSSEKLPPPLSSGSGQQGADCRLCMGLAGSAPAGSEAPSEHPGLDQFCPGPTPLCSSGVSYTYQCWDQFLCQVASCGTRAGTVLQQQSQRALLCLRRTWVALVLPAVHVTNRKKSVYLVSGAFFSPVHSFFIMQGSNNGTRGNFSECFGLSLGLGSITAGFCRVVF